MCDSAISVSCPADFTSYCPADALCDEGVRPQKMSWQRPSVRSRVALFTRKAKGQTYPRQGISTQPKIKPLGEESCTTDESDLHSFNGSAEAIPIDCSSESTTEDEEGAAIQDNSWLHEQSSSYASPEELHALKGCVTRGRALFSPTPLSNTASEHSKVGIHMYCSTQVSSCDLSVNGNTLSPPTSIPVEAGSHFRQGSYEYDHLEDFHPDQSPCSGNLFSENNLNEQTSLTDSCSVSVQFGSAGYECKAICETKDVPNSSLCEEKVENQNETNFGENVEHGKGELNLLPHAAVGCLSLSQSTPGRLNSPNLRFGHHCVSSVMCHCPSCCPCGSFQKKIQDESPKQVESFCVPQVALTHLPEQQHQERYNSWPRHKVCPLIQHGSDTKYQKISRMQEKRVVPAGSSALVHGSDLKASPCLKIESVASLGGSEVLYQQMPCLGSLVSLKSVNSFQTHLSWSNASSSCEHQHVRYVKGVDGKVFKEKVDMLLSWFAEFSDQQKNMMLARLLEKCNCAQMHFLSVQMEPILHDGCPHNCQDLLSWLPQNITLHVLSFLDPVSLCRATQVSHSWFHMANVPKLWMALCRMSKWQLSPVGEVKQLKRFTLVDGTVQWKQMFAERFRLRRNWLNGYCNVRTFEGHMQGISCIQFDDTRIVSGSWDKTIKVWNRRTNTAWAALTLVGHSGTVRCLHLHGNRLVSGSSDRTIKVWDLATDKVGWVGATCRTTMVGHMHTVRCLQADDEKVISGSYDLTLKVWDIKTGTCNHTLRGHTDAVLCVQFDKEKVVSGSKDTTIKIWSLPDGQCQLTLHGHQAAVTCLQFDDTRIISGALDTLIKIWNIASGECIRTMDWIRSEGHTGVVRHLQADSWKIVSGADDKTLKVWSVHTGDRLLTLKSHSDGVTCLQFNDEVIVSGSYDKSVKLWDFSAC